MEAQDVINVQEQTLDHIGKVQSLMIRCIEKLLERLEGHDKSKLLLPEVEYFVKYTKELAGQTYGGEEYKSTMEKMKPALDHHYAKNRHHPEHFKNGINDMTLIDLIELICDWKSATLRHHDGNIRKSLEINSKRFGIDSQLIKILENTVELLEYE